MLEIMLMFYHRTIRVISYKYKLRVLNKFNSIIYPIEKEFIFGVEIEYIIRSVKRILK